MECISTELILDDIPQEGVVSLFCHSGTRIWLAGLVQSTSIKTAPIYFSTIILKPHNYFLNCDAGTKVDKYNNRTEYSNRLINIR